MDIVTKRFLEKQLRDYPSMIERINKRKLELKYPINLIDENIGGSSGGGISNPTERTVMTLVEDIKLQKLEETKEAIELVLDTLDINSYTLIELKYWVKPQVRTWDGIALQVGYSRRHCFTIRDNVLDMLAEKLGYD